MSVLLQAISSRFCDSSKKIMLWLAEGLVQPGGKNESPEDIAERCLIKLIAHGMVQMINKKPNGNVNSCRLPDALRQHWLSKAQQATFLQVQANTRSELSQSTGLIHHLADHLDKEDVSFDHIHGGYNIASTSLMPQYCLTDHLDKEGRKPGEDIGNFLHRCISSSFLLLLRVLDPENVFRPKLPRELGKITRLRYLGLRWTFLEMIPSSVSKLQNLQTLDLKHTSISTLPNSIWKMPQLRHLYLSESYLSKFMSQPQASFPTALQTLSGLLIDEETPVKDGLDKLINLRKLGLACPLIPSQQGTMLLQLETVADWILKLNRLESLRLKSVDTNNQPWDLVLKPLSVHGDHFSLYLLGWLNNPSILSEFPESH